MPTEVLLITGAAGVGKSTVSWEVSEELKRRGLPHAVIDTDELDRVWPLELDDPRRRAINVTNLTAWWSGYRDLGVERREIGSGFDAQLARTLQYAEWINQLPRGDEVVVDTDGIAVTAVAVQLCDLMHWRG